MTKNKKFNFKQKIINWFKYHKPVDWKWMIIIILLIELFKARVALFFMFILGFVTYPHEIDYKPIFQRAGDRIGEVYNAAMIKLYEAGINLGSQLHPHNVWLGMLINYGIVAIMITLIFCLLVYIVNVIVYKKGKKNATKRTHNN